MKNNLHKKEVSLSEEQIVAINKCFDLCAKQAEDTINTALLLHMIKVELGIDSDSLKKIQMEHTLSQAKEEIKRREESPKNNVMKG